MLNSIKRIAVVAMVAICCAISSAAMSANYFVAKIGSDSNPGSIGQPFLTIQKAASVMYAGDTCFIRAGVYREQVTLPRSGSAGSPIRFINYPDESVTISGAETLSGWSLYSGSIYRASTTSSFTQLFVDGQMMNEARWPNTGTDMIHQTQATAGSGTTDDGTTVNLYDPNLTQANGYWNGATIHVTPGEEWVSWTPTISNYTTGHLTFSAVANIWAYVVKQGNRYHLTGKLACLDTANEWFLDDPANYAYLWTPAGDSPSAHLVEYKARTYAIDASNRSYITINGLNIFAATINLTGSAYCVIDNCNLKYLSHFNAVSGWGTGETSTGIIVSGSYNEIKNSSLAYSAGNGISLQGNYNKVTNCIIHDVDYEAIDCAAIFSGGTGHTISRNTLYNSGRSVLVHRQTTASTLSYNNIYDGGHLTKDCGNTYAFQTDGLNTTLSYNWVHNNVAMNGPGLYLDNDSRNYYVHHNVCYNNTGGGASHGIWLNCPDNNLYIYNNTTYNNSSGGINIGVDVTPSNIQIKNNISQSPNVGSISGVTRSNNYFYSTASSPQFVNYPGADFRLQSTSPCKNAGMVISGITDGYLESAPDEGAYEYGGTAWYPGPQRDSWLWDFNTAGDLQGWTPVQQMTNVSVSGGSLHADITSWDPIMTISPAAFINSDCRYLRVRIKNATAASLCEVFWSTWTGYSKGVQFSIVPNDTSWREYVMDLGQYAEWRDGISSFRLDPVAQGGGSLTGHIDIDCIELSKYRGPKWQFDRDGDLEGWTTHTNNNLVNLNASGGCLRGDVTSWDPILIGPTINVDASIYKYLKIRMKNGTPATNGEFWGNSTYYSFPVKPNDTGFTDYVIDLTTNSGWSGTITSLRLDPVAQGGGSLTGHVDIDSIEFLQISQDSEPPTGSVTINSGAAVTGSQLVTLSLSATDNTSGVSKMRLANDSSSYGSWLNYATSTTWLVSSGTGTKTVNVQFQDGVGNVSSTYSDTIILDVTPPDGSILINNDAAYTSSPSVTLNLSATDSISGVSQMCFSNDGSSYSTWQAYAPTASWTLTSGNGTKTVYAQFKDGVGNISTIYYSDSIVLGTPVTIPQAKDKIPGAEAILHDVVVTAKFADCIYVESTDRYAGIKVTNYPSVNLWDKIDLTGSMVLSAGEKAIQCDSWSTAGSKQLRALGLRNSALGGANWDYISATNAGQQGVAGATGLNNIGLLVRISGKYTYVNSTTFTVNDGSGLITCEVPSGTTLQQGSHFVSVTGISSVAVDGSLLHPKLKVRDVSDITIVQ